MNTAPMIGSARVRNAHGPGSCNWGCCRPAKDRANTRQVKRAEKRKALREARDEA